MEELKGKEFLVNNNADDHEELGRVVSEATKEVLRRTGGAGFPLLCVGYHDTTFSAVRGGVETAGATPLVYNSATEVKVEEWLRKRRSGEEERVLIADEE